MHPALFTNLDFAAALERATIESKLLLVDATAALCGPCAMMDRTTWRNPEVVACLRARGLAIQVDVDSGKGLARELRITATPTVIAFVQGKEFDRVVGAKKPKELLDWLEGISRGETWLVALERTIRNHPVDTRARYDFGRELSRAGRYDEALGEYLWLWEHMLESDRALYGVRMSFLADEFETLANAYAPAREAIVELRDRAAPPCSGPIDVAIFSDWTCLNRVLGENERTLAWYDDLPATKRSDLRPLLEHHIVPLLVEAERWAEAGALYGDALTTLNRTADALVGTDLLTGQMVEALRDLFRQETAQLVRALSAAGRLQEVDQVVRRAREVDPAGKKLHSLADAKS